MAYTALTCEELEQPLETLFRRAMIDNGDGSYSLQTVAFSAPLSFTLTSGSVTDTYTYRFDFEGFSGFVRNGYEGEASIGYPVWSVVRADNVVEVGSTWCVTDASAGVIYYSTDDVDDPRDCTTWILSLGGTLPLPVIS